MSRWQDTPKNRPPVPALAALAATALLATGCAVREPRYPAPVVESASVTEYPAGPMPAPITESPPPAPATSGWNWVPGHWEWTGRRWHWERGHWVDEPVSAVPPDVEESPGPPPSSTHVWIRGHWRWGGHGWVWVRGRWIVS